MTVPIRRRSRRHSYEGRRHERQRYGWTPPTPHAIDDGVSTFRVYHVMRLPLLKVMAAARSVSGGVIHERPTAIELACQLAKTDGQTVVDVVRADYQDSGDWTVELRVVRR